MRGGESLSVPPRHVLTVADVGEGIRGRRMRRGEDRFTELKGATQKRRRDGM